MTIVRSKFHTRITTFEAQLEETPEFEAQHTTSLGAKEVIAYRVKSQEGIVYIVELGERSTVVKSCHHGLGAEVRITVHPTRILEGLKLIHNLVKASSALGRPAA